MNFDLSELLSKTARILSEDDQPNSNPALQALVGDPQDSRISTFAQFKPNPGGVELPDMNSPTQGDDCFTTYLWPGAKFEDKNRTQWQIENYGSPDEIEITNVWYPRQNLVVGIDAIRSSIYAWIEPIYQIVPPPPVGVTYSSLPVRVVNEDEGARQPTDSSTGMSNSGTNGGW
jgi:hypothetical protein